MTDYDKVCKILIDRCKTCLSRHLIRTPALAFSGIYGKISVAGNSHKKWWLLCIKDEYGYMQSIEFSKEQQTISNDDVIDCIFSVCKDHDIYVGINFNEKILDKGESLESLLIEYDLKEEND